MKPLNTETNQVVSTILFDNRPIPITGAEARIMVVDDTEIDCIIATKLLEMNRIGKTISNYSSPIVALKAITDSINHLDGLPDVILLDMHMPMMNGNEFMEGIKKLDPAYPKPLYIVAISGYDEQQTLSLLQDTSAVCAIIRKPLTTNRIRQLFVT